MPHLEWSLRRFLTFDLGGEDTNCNPEKDNINTWSITKQAPARIYIMDSSLNCRISPALSLCLSMSQDAASSQTCFAPIRNFICLPACTVSPRLPAPPNRLWLGYSEIMHSEIRTKHKVVYKEWSGSVKLFLTDFIKQVKLFKRFWVVTCSGTVWHFFKSIQNNFC